MIFRSVFHVVLLHAALGVASPLLADDDSSPVTDRVVADAAKVVDGYRNRLGVLRREILREAALKVKSDFVTYKQANEESLANARALLRALATRMVDEGRAQESAVVLKQIDNVAVDLNRQLSVGNGQSASSLPDVRDLMNKVALQMKMNRDVLGRVLHSPAADARKAFEQIAKVLLSDGRGLEQANAVLQWTKTMEDDIMAMADALVSAPDDSKDQRARKTRRAKRMNAVRFNGSGNWYLVVLGKYNWHDAKRACEAEGGHLAIIDDPAELNFVRNLCRGMTKGARCWIGATDEPQEGVWRWVDGSPLTYANWIPGEPNNTGGEHYLEIDAAAGGGWNDGPLGTLQCFICEWDE